MSIQSITLGELRSEALQARFYNLDENKWESMGWIEWLARKFFCCFFDSVQKTCLARSWNAIEKMSTIPVNIKQHIEDLFLDSLYPTNPLSAHSGVISRIFCRTEQERARSRGFPLNEIEIKQHPKERSFGIFYNEELHYLVANSGYGRLDFYDSQLKKVSTNDHDSLWNRGGDRIGAIKLAVDYPRLDVCMELYTGKDQLLTKVDQNKEKVTLVFRDVLTNRILAVGNFSMVKSLINWKVTIIDQKAMNPLLLSWAILKFSQHHHFPNPRELRYVKTVPKLQVFQG